MHTIEHEPVLNETQVISPQVLQMVDVLKTQGHTAEMVVQELRDYSDSLWEDYRNGPEELRGSGNIEALSAAMEKDREWSGQLYWLAHFIEQEGDIDAGLERFVEVETMKTEQLESKIEWGADTPEADSKDARIFQVAAVYGALDGKPGLVLHNRKEITRMIEGAKVKGQTATEFLASLDDTYFEADVKGVARRMFVKARIAEAALMLSVLVAGNTVADAVLSEDANVEVASAVPVIHPETTTSTDAVTTTSLAPTTTTTVATATTVVPATTVPPTTTTMAPPIVYSNSQRKLGVKYSFRLNAEPLEDAAAGLSTKLGELWDVPTLREFTGIEPGFVGTTWVYDCPDGTSVLIREGESLSEIARDNQTTVEAIKALMPDGEPRIWPGLCLPIPPK